MKTYFVSYQYSIAEGYGFGNCIIKMPRKIKRETDIDKLAAEVKCLNKTINGSLVTNMVILNYQLI